MQLRGASALVTGAGRGIGRAIAIALGAQGAAVTLVARTAQELEAAAEEVRRAGGRALVHRADLTQSEACRVAVEAAVRAHGRLQILVNNAGVGVHASLVETSDSDWERTIGTNLTAVFRLTRAALPHLTAGGGHVFMISSLAGANPIAGMSAYCASKAALDHLSACLMLEVRQQGVKVTTIAPGSVDTTFGGSAPADASWMLRPEDIADQLIALLLMRDEAHSSRVEMRPARPQKRT
jgi:NAD(P)-dependent dehydrogenase (short-subunit alcohol dehydrogenase family)